MKLLFRSYLASLRERDELDAILPDLLSELGFTVYSRPQRGTAQAGVDVAAVGIDEDGERKVFLFSVKQGDLTRQSWNDGTVQGLQPSLDEILNNYIPHRIPKRYQKLKVVICVVFGGDMQEQVRSAVTGYFGRNSNRKVSFDEWNGDKLAGLLIEGVLREKVMPKALQFSFQKSVAMVDEPDIAYRHFMRLVKELNKLVTSERTRIRVARQLYIAAWVLFVWARDAGNIDSAYRASELVLLHIWNLFRPYIGRKPNKTGKELNLIINYTVQLHLTIALELLDKKLLPHVGTRDGISTAVHTRASVDVNIKLFDVLGRIALTGLWVQWFAEREPNLDRKAVAQRKANELTTQCFQLIENNRALFLPIQDQQAIEISLFLLLVGVANGNLHDTRSWLHQMVDRLALSIRTHGRYPCIFSDYRDLVAHPRERTEEYRRDATAGSILIPLIAAFTSALNDRSAFETLISLKAKELAHCTLQLWLPDKSSEEGIYVGSQDHGVALCEIPLSDSNDTLIQTIDKACRETEGFVELSAIATGFWPLILTACRHYRLPVPPQLWISLVRPEPSLGSETTAS